MQRPQAASRNGLAQVRGRDVLARLRARAPRVHCITNAVAQNFTANVLLAAGAVPSMTLSPEEIGAFVAGAAGAAGQSRHLRRERREAATIAVEAATQQASALGARSGVRRPRAAARRFCARADRPRADGGAAQSCRVFRACRRRRRRAMTRMRLRAGSTAPSWRCPARPTSSPTASALRAIANGHPLMAKVTAMGCAGSALVAACLAVEPDAFRAAVAALADHRASPANWRRARRQGRAASPSRSSMRCTISMSATLIARAKVS